MGCFGKCPPIIRGALFYSYVNTENNKQSLKAGTVMNTIKDNLHNRVSSAAICESCN